MIQRSLKSENRYSNLFLPEDTGPERTQTHSAAGAIVPIWPTALRLIVRRKPRGHQRLAGPLPGPLPLLVSLLSVDLPHLLQPLLIREAPEFPVIDRGVVGNMDAPSHPPSPRPRPVAPTLPFRFGRLLPRPARSPTPPRSALSPAPPVPAGAAAPVPCASAPAVPRSSATPRRAPAAPPPSAAPGPNAAESLGFFNSLLVSSTATK